MSSTQSNDKFISKFQENFEMLKFLGKGDGGLVFHVKEKKDNKEYAIKRIDMTMKTHKEIERELKIKDCHHRNIVEYFDSWIEYPPPMWQEIEDRKWKREMGRTDLIPLPLPYYGNESMESVEPPIANEQTQPKYLYIQIEICKSDLANWLYETKTKARVDKVLTIFEEIVAAVEYIHSKGLIHRDLKPENIFFGLDGHIRIGDFGVTTEHEKLKNHSRNQSTSVTHSQGVGTRWYKAPEMQTSKYDQRVDIYALGIILYELLTPFRTESERFDGLERLRSTPFPKYFDVSFKNQFELMKKMLSKNPKKRPSIQMIEFHLTGWGIHAQSSTVSIFEILRHIIEGNRSLLKIPTEQLFFTVNSNKRDKISDKTAKICPQKPKKDFRILQ